MHLYIPFNVIFYKNYFLIKHYFLPNLTSFQIVPLAQVAQRAHQGRALSSESPGWQCWGRGQIVPIFITAPGGSSLTKSGSEVHSGRNWNPRCVPESYSWESQPGLHLKTVSATERLLFSRRAPSQVPQSGNRKREVFLTYVTYLPRTSDPTQTGMDVRE